MDARDGSVYGRDIELPYEPGVWYTVVISADIASQSYDVEVARCGEPLQALIRGAAFRSDSTVSDQLATWGAWSAPGAELDIATPSWVAQGSCASATCESLSLECGGPNDGCGGNLSCGSCESGERCEAGTCVETPLAPPSSEGGVRIGLTDDFVPSAAEAIDSGSTAGSIPDYDIVGEERPKGVTPGRGVFEMNP